MSTNHTANYNLNQWEPGDKVLRTDFNEDNGKIDGALAAHDAALAEKADRSAVDVLSQTVGGHTSALAKKGNCQVYTTSFVGNGTHGSGSPTRLTFPVQPLVVSIVGSDSTWLNMFRGEGKVTAGMRFGSSYTLIADWSGNSVSWYNANSSSPDQMNGAGVSYQVTVLYAL